jgi:hypothetical protein
VRDLPADQPAHQPVVHPGRGALDPGVGGPVRAHAVHHVDVGAAGLLEQIRDHLGRVLQVGVEADQVVTEGALEAGREGRLVPAVAQQPDHPQLGPGGGLRRQQLGRPVPAAVVDRDEFVAHVERVQHRSDTVEEDGQHGFLVVHRDDDGQQWVDRIRHGADLLSSLTCHGRLLHRERRPGPPWSCGLDTSASRSPAG